MKTSFITTVYNEENNIEKLLVSLVNQSQNPDEIIIVDGKSTDKTVRIIKSFANKFNRIGIIFKLIIKKGNRSVGRNEAIRKAGGDIILCSDSGCVLDKNWIKNIIKPFVQNETDVVAGYYKGLSQNIFQKCLIPYVLVMPDKVNPENFLPAARSIAFRKSAWKKVGAFPEQFSNNEDLVFSRRLKDSNFKLIFQKDALVHWIPRKNFREAFIMFFRFALGDAEAGLFRPKVLLIFIRYIAGIVILLFAVKFNSHFILYSLYFILLIYIIWSINKNYKYVKDIRAFVILPLLQIMSDIAVISGTILGLYKYGI